MSRRASGSACIGDSRSIPCAVTPAALPSLYLGERQNFGDRRAVLSKTGTEPLPRIFNKSLNCRVATRSAVPSKAGTFLDCHPCFTATEVAAVRRITARLREVQFSRHRPQATKRAEKTKCGIAESKYSQFRHFLISASASEHVSKLEN